MSEIMYEKLITLEEVIEVLERGAKRVDGIYYNYDITAYVVPTSKGEIYRIDLKRRKR